MQRRTMSSDSDSLRAALDEHPRADALARVTLTAAASAADEQRVRLSDGLEELMEDHELGLEDGELDGANVLEALRDDEWQAPPLRDAVEALLLHALRLEDDEPRAEHGARLCWLAAHSPIDVVSRFDELGALADALWPAIASAVREPAAEDGKGTQLAAAAALAASESTLALEARGELAAELDDPLLLAALASGQHIGDDDATVPRPSMGGGVDTVVEGELVPAPHGPVALVLLAITGILFLSYLWRFVTGVLLRCRRPASLAVGPTGVTLSSKLEVAGRVVRSSEAHIPRAQLARAIREVRYPRLALYVGLIALAVGSYFGVALVSDGSRAGSPSLLLMGVAVFGVGVVLDLVLSSLWHKRAGRLRLVLVPRRGRALALSTKDSHGASAALQRLSARTAG
jgi:hypothetical protein